MTDARRRSKHLLKIGQALSTQEFGLIHNIDLGILLFQDL